MTGLEILIAILASMAGGAALGGVGVYWRARSAPARFVKRIRKQIDKAIEEGADRAIINAKIIVASRNALAQSLEALDGLLDSEISKLEGLLVNGYEASGVRPARRGGEVPRPDPQVVFEQLQVLRGYWEAREDTIATSIKKVLVDLNIL